MKCAESILAGEQTVRIVALPLSYPDFASGTGLEPATAVRSNRNLRHRPGWSSIDSDPLASVAILHSKLHRQKARNYIHVGLRVLADRGRGETSATR